MTPERDVPAHPTQDIRFSIQNLAEILTAPKLSPDFWPLNSDVLYMCV
jgi:hypothetical protein